MVRRIRITEMASQRQIYALKLIDYWSAVIAPIHKDARDGWLNVLMEFRLEDQTITGIFRACIDEIAEEYIDRNSPIKPNATLLKKRYEQKKWERDRDQPAANPEKECTLCDLGQRYIIQVNYKGKIRTLPLYNTTFAGLVYVVPVPCLCRADQDYHGYTRDQVERLNRYAYPKLVGVDNRSLNSSQHAWLYAKIMNDHYLDGTGNREFPDA